MNNITYNLNGSECNPLNREEINYVLDFSPRSRRDLELSVDTLRFTTVDADVIDTWRNTYGDYVGMPLDVQYSNGTVVRYLLDFSDPATVFRDRDHSVKLIRYRGFDNFFDKAEGLSFGRVDWAASDFQDVDYVIVPDNQFAYIISISIATFSLAQELSKAIQEIAEGIADVVKAAIPVGLPIPAPDWGAIVVAAIKLAARIAYALFIAVALIKLATELLNLLFPKIRQLKGIKLRRLIEKGCLHEGYTLQSTLLDELDDVVVLPVPLRAKDPTLWKEIFQPLSLAYTNGYPSVRDTIPTLGKAINFLEKELNGEVRVQNGVVQIELEQFYEQQASTTMSEAFNLQGALQDERTINSDEIFKRLTILYQVDPSDINTFDDSRKSLFESSSEIQNSPGPAYETVKKAQRVDMPFARGTRKGSLTPLEELARVFAKAIDLFAGTNLEAKVAARKDVMQISTQYFGVTKLLRMNGTKLHPDQNAKLGAEAIAQTYWEQKLIENNQKNRKKGMPLELTESEFFNYQANNYLNLNNGGTVKITRVHWNDNTNMSEIDFEKRKPAINEQTDVIHAG